MALKRKGFINHGSTLSTLRLGGLRVRYSIALPHGCLMSTVVLPGGSGGLSKCTENPSKPKP